MFTAMTLRMKLDVPRINNVAASVQTRRRRKLLQNHHKLATTQILLDDKPQQHQKLVWNLLEQLGKM
jgi:hypothetical protein